MPATKVNLSQMVDLAVGTPEVGAVNFNVLHTLLHAMLKRLNIVDVQAEISEFDRDFLSASKARELSVLSDVDSGRGDDADDAFSERSSAMPTPSTGRKTPYHLLEVKVAKMQEQLESITSVPSNKHLLEKTRTQYEEKPIGEMWLNMQLMSKVETNEKGIAKCMSLIEDMAKEMQALRDEHKKQLDLIKGLNIDDLMKRLNALEKSMNEMNNKFNTLPSADDLAKFVTRAELEDALQGIRKDFESKMISLDDFAQCVTWAGLEDALQGIRQDWENMQQPTLTERVVIEMSSQTDPVKRPHKPSRPTSSRSVTRGGSPGPSGALLEILEKLGKLCESHEELTKRVEELEAEMKKKLDQGALDGLNLSSELLGQLQELKEQVDALAAAREKDLESVFFQSPPVLRRLSEVNFVLDHYGNRGSRTNNLEDHDALLKLRDENREEFKKLFAYCDELQENKADRTEVDVKADKRTLDNKVNHSLFDTTTSDISRMIKEILDKMAGNEEAWNQQCKVFTDDIEGKLDRLELDPLKEWLMSRLKALNDKLKKQNQAPVEWTDDDAAGIRRQLIQKYHCISCDRPIDIVPTGPVPSMPSVSSHQALHPTRSPRPYLTFEMDQIRQHAQRMYAGIDRPGSRYANAEIADYYATNRSCGGQHTTTFPHKRLTKMSHLSNTVIKEDGETNIYPLYKEEIEVQGADGNIYKGRMDRLEAKLPSMTQATQDSISMQRRDRSPQPVRHKVMRVTRPSSAKVVPSPRPPSKNGSRPQSARQTVSPQAMAGSSHTTPCQSPVPQEIISVEQAQQNTREIPSES